MEASRQCSTLSFEQSAAAWDSRLIAVGGKQGSGDECPGTICGFTRRLARLTRRLTDSELD